MSTDGDLLKNLIAKFIVFVSYLQNYIGCLSDGLLIFNGCSDSLLILLVVSFDDLLYRQENICLKFIRSFFF